MTDEQRNKLESLMDAVASGRMRRALLEEELKQVEKKKSANSVALQAAERDLTNYQNDLLREKAFRR